MCNLTVSTKYKILNGLTQPARKCPPNPTCNRYNTSLSGATYTNNIEVAQDGNIVVGGVFSAATTQGPFPELPQNRYLLLKYAPDGTQLWNTSYYVGSVYEAVYSLASMVTDKAGNIYTAGLEQFLTTNPNPRVGTSSTYYQFLTAKFTSDGSLAWLEPVNTTKANSSYLSDIIISDNENIYVTGITLANKVRTIKYVQCPSNAPNARYSNPSNNNSSVNDNETLPAIGNTPWIYAKPNPINESSIIAINTASQNECVVIITDIFL